MRENRNKRLRATINVSYLEGPDVYRFRCDDPDLDWDVDDWEAERLEDAKAVQRCLTIELERLGRDVAVEHSVTPDFDENDKPGANGRYQLESIPAKLF